MKRKSSGQGEIPDRWW